MKSSMFDKITRAIDGRNLLRVVDEAGVRIIEPYLVFESAKGDMLLHGWLRSGGFRHTPPPHWCNLHLDDLLEAEVLPERFAQPHRDYNPRSSMFHRIIFELDGRGPRQSTPSAASNRVRPKTRRAPPRTRAKPRVERNDRSQQREEE